jgi:antitoxin (DNA-binding transcriptional repressor) of toxin-antitoxin stability system
MQPAKQVDLLKFQSDLEAILQAIVTGESFVLTRDGVAIASLSPLRDAPFSRTEDVMAAFRGAPAMSFTRFRDDVDAVVDQGLPPYGR